MLTAVGCFVFLLLIPSVSHAYLGPGLALGAVMSALSILGVIGLAIVATVYYPLRRWTKRLTGKPDEQEVLSESLPEIERDQSKE